jgi:hypothetical protein
MKNVTRSLVLVAVLAFLVLVPSAFAGDFALTSGGPTVYGEETGPYAATWNGSAISVWCDDIRDNQNIGSHFPYNMIAGNAIIYGAGTNVMWGNDVNAMVEYGALAYLAVAINGNSALGQALYSFAMWDIFEPGIVASKIGAGISPFSLAQVTNLVTFAEANYTAADLAMITVYTPVGCAGLGNNQIQNCLPNGGAGAQEFVAVPDGGVTLMLLGGALVGLATLRRRFRA